MLGVCVCVCAHWVVCVHQAVCVPVCFLKGECWEKDQGPVLGFSGDQTPAVLSQGIPTAGMQRVIHRKPGLCMAKGRPCTNALHVHMGFPGGSDSKEFACNVGDLGSIPGLGRSLGEGNGNPLQHSCLENSKDTTVHQVAKSQTGLSDTFSLSREGLLASAIFQQWGLGWRLGEGWEEAEKSCCMPGSAVHGKLALTGGLSTQARTGL